MLAAKVRDQADSADLQVALGQRADVDALAPVRRFDHHRRRCRHDHMFRAAPLPGARDQIARADVLPAHRRTGMHQVIGGARQVHPGLRGRALAPVAAHGAWCRAEIDTGRRSMTTTR